MSESGKSITIFEVDVDLYRLTQFEHNKTDQPAPNFTSKWSSQGSLVGKAVPEFPTGMGIRLANSGSDALIAFQWAIPPDMSQTRSRALFRVPSASPVLGDPGIVLRGSGSSGNESGYIVALGGINSNGQGTLVSISRVVAGSYEVLTEFDFSWDFDENIWLMAEAINIVGGVIVRYKVWKGQLSQEPSTFSGFFEDTGSPDLAIETAGWTAPFVSSAGAIVDIGHFHSRSILKSHLETLRFAKPTNYLPKEFGAIPCIEGVSLSPGTISLGEDMGTRGRLTVSFSDFLGSDLGEGYENGTYWGKFRSRFPHIENCKSRLKRGLLGQSLSEFETKNYIVQTFDGPTPGGIYSITSQDPLKLADGNRSQCPVLSNGFLLSGITSGSGSCNLAPAGIGDLEYPASGYVSIGGKEICAFTRSGDTLTLTRAQQGTTAVAHSNDDRVQLCEQFNAQRASDIMYRLATVFAGIDSSYIDLAAWNEEDDTYLQLLYTRIIPEPTRVDELMKQLINQAGLAIGWDDESQLIRFQVLRGINISESQITEDQIIEGSLRTTEQPDKRISQVWVSFGVLNPLDPLDEPNNYRSTVKTIDEDSESFYGSSRIQKIYASWIPPFGRQTSDRVAQLYLGRFVRPPRKIDFDLYKFGEINPQLLQGYRVGWRFNQDETGSIAFSGAPIQIVRRSTTVDRIQIESEEMLIRQFAATDLTNRVITIDSNINNVNLPDLHNSIYPSLTDQDVIDGVNLTVVISPSIIVGSTSVSEVALNVGTSSDWPSGFPITLDVRGRIQGKGGDGGRGRGETGSSGKNGQNGGDALFLRVPVDIEFGPSGQIWSGGGGGGGGTTANGAAFTSGGGGGGAGTTPGNGGASNGTSAAANGTSEAGGSGRSGTANGGDGGDPGQNGQNGTRNPSFVQPAGTGGTAGDSINGTSYATITVGPGDIRGPQTN